MHSQTDVALVMAQLAQGATCYDLAQPTDRKLSARQLRWLFFNMIRALQPDVFAEAGARNAANSMKVRHSAPKARIIAFEANPHNHAYFSERYDYAAHGVEYRLQAVTDYVGPVTFKLLMQEGDLVHKPTSGRSSLLTREKDDVRYEDVTVPGTTLDAALDGSDGRAALWVDVEGATRQVLGGAAYTLTRTDLVMIEVETRPYWQGQWLHTDICAHLMESGLVPVARDFEYRFQFNLLFVHPQALARPDILHVLEQFHSARGSIRESRR
jgi:FkbM family methyltransferase